MKTKFCCRGKRAFSLVEVMVATIILALIVTMLATLISRASQLWIFAEAQNQRRSTGRALLQFIARDLEMATIPVPYPSLNSSAANLQFVTSSTNVIDSSILNPHAVFFQAPVASNRSRGDLAEIGYFVRWDTQSQPGTAKAQLCRFEVDPSDSQNYRIYAKNADGTPANWLDASTIDQVAPSTAAENYRGWFADNVIALWIRCLDSQGKPILKAASGTSLNGGYGFDSRQGYLSPSSGAAQYAPALPASVEIVLVAVDAQTAKRIKSPIVATPGSPENFDKDQSTVGSLAHFVATLPDSVKPGVQVFSTRVYLKNSNRTP